MGGPLAGANRLCRESPSRLANHLGEVAGSGQTARPMMGCEGRRVASAYSCEAAQALEGFGSVSATKGASAPKKTSDAAFRPLADAF